MIGNIALYTKAEINNSIRVIPFSRLCRNLLGGQVPGADVTSTAKIHFSTMDSAQTVSAYNE